MRMPRYIWASLLFAMAAIAKEPVTELAPFEPRYADCYKWSDKFDHPKELVSPAYSYPHQMRHEGIVGQVVALVILNADGSPAKIAVLYDTHAPDTSFGASVVEGLKAARWERQEKAGVWFYYKVTFELVDPDEKFVEEPGVVYDYPCSESGCDHPRSEKKPAIKPPQTTTGNSAPDRV